LATPASRHRRIIPFRKTPSSFIQHVKELSLFLNLSVYFRTHSAPAAAIIGISGGTGFTTPEKLPVLLKIVCAQCAQCAQTPPPEHSGGVGLPET
jgi:hypothetical protein